MTPESLFAPRKFRRGSLLFSFLGAIALEGLVICVAQLWVTPVRATFEPGPTVIDSEPPLGEQPPLDLPKDEAVPTPEEPIPTPLETPVVEDTPPVEQEQEMMLETPRPTLTPAPQRVPRRTAAPATMDIRRGDQPPVGVPGGTGRVSQAIGAPGGRATGVRPRTPRPPYPFQARAAKLTGSGVCHVTFDGSGRVASAVMTQSIGNALLDSNTVSYARSSWSGQPNSSADVPVTYQLR